MECAKFKLRSTELLSLKNASLKLDVDNLFYTLVLPLTNKVMIFFSNPLTLALLYYLTRTL